MNSPTTPTVIEDVQNAEDKRHLDIDQGEDERNVIL